MWPAAGPEIAISVGDAGGLEAEELPEVTYPEPHEPPAPLATDPVVELKRQEELLEEDEMQETRIMEPIPEEGEIKVTATPWLDEVSDSRPGESLEWPAPTVTREVERRERVDTPRVRHLFPVPDSDWEVSHLEFEYDRNSAG